MTIKQKIILWFIKRIGIADLIIALDSIGIEVTFSFMPRIDYRWFSVFEKHILKYGYNGFLTEC